MAEGNIICSICLEKFNDPRTIPCNHVFCSGCLERHVEKNAREGSFACPLCKREVKVCIDGVSSVNGETINQRGISRDVSIQCDVCGPKMSAASRCLACEENYCLVCSASHMKMKFSRNHTLRDLGVLDQEEKITLRRHVFCPEHLEEEIKIVCKTCKNIPICQFCKILKHDTHRSRILAEEAMELRSILEKNISLCAAKLEYLEHSAKNGEALDEDIDKSEQEDIKKVIREEDELICLLQYQRDKIKKQAQQLREDIRQHYEKARKENDGYKEKIAKEKSDCVALHNEAREMIDTASDFQILKVADILSEKLKLLEENRRCSNIQPKQGQRKAITPAEKWMQSIKLKMTGLLTDMVREEHRKMTIFLSYDVLGYSTRSLEVDIFQAVETIKTRIAQKYCIEEGIEVILRFIGKELKNERTLYDYGIQEGSTLVCSLRPFLGARDNK